MPPLRLLDSVGGLLLGAATGAAIVWVAGAVALHLPGQTQLREEVQRSKILGEINERVPPSRLLDAIERVDPFLVDQRPGGERGAARSRPPRQPGRPRRPRQRLPRHRHGLRPRHRRLGLGGGAEPGRDERPRRRRHEGPARRPARRRLPRCRRRRLRRPRRHRDPPRGRARREAARGGCAGGGPVGRDPRLPEQRPLHRHAGPDRPDDGRAHRGRVRARARSAARSRRCAARSATATRAGRRSTSAAGCRRRSSPPGSAPRTRASACRRSSSEQRLAGAGARPVSTGPCVG